MDVAVNALPQTVLFGKLHVLLDRGSSEGMKVACTNFQCAAWSFHTIPDRFPQHTGGSDMSADLLAFLSQVWESNFVPVIVVLSLQVHATLPYDFVLEFGVF